MIEIEKTYQFTEDWWTMHVPMWKARVVPILIGRDRILEIGCFEGRASCWFLENVLGYRGQLVCVDTFLGSPEFEMLPESHRINIKERFLHNTSIARGLNQTVTVYEASSTMALAQLIRDSMEPSFDLIYIDAGHEVTQTFSDSVMAWPLLKSGGLMVWDDYLWNLNGDAQSRPKFAIDVFTTLWNPYLVHLGAGNQYIVQKK